MNAEQKLAFLGLGQMGAPISRLLLAQGHNVTLWNRSRDKAESVATGNARIATSPGEAAAHADIVSTMLTDDAATEAVLFGDKHQPGFLDALQPGAIHITLSTISVAL
ncbi:MAG: NAD(P)-binding domain-containing protein, partial [Acidobacteriaceae bacterium]